MLYINRELADVIASKLFTNNVIVLYGQRQVGKTTLVKHLLEGFGESGLYWNCEDPEIHSLLSSFQMEKIFQYFKGKRVVVLDEAQRIPQIGALLKLLFDTHPEVQYIATGSSSFELSQQVGEPLVGRSWEFTLYPFGITELLHSELELKRNLDSILLYGTYPEIWNLGNEDKEIKLKTIASQYLYKDLLIFEVIRHSTVLQNLLRLLAAQIGNEVSYNELASHLETSRQTVIRYLDILEKSFVLFRLHNYRKNLRREVGGKFKVYFSDLGVRNAILNQFGPIDPLTRTDLGSLFENFCILERRKWVSHHGGLLSSYFWRDVNEVDYLEEKNGEIMAFECKWSPKSRTKIPKAFVRAFKPVSFQVVHRDNVLEFISS